LALVNGVNEGFEFSSENEWSLLFEFIFELNKKKRYNNQNSATLSMKFKGRRKLPFKNTSPFQSNSSTKEMTSSSLQGDATKGSSLLSFGKRLICKNLLLKENVNSTKNFYSVKFDLSESFWERESS